MKLTQHEVVNAPSTRSTSKTGCSPYPIRNTRPPQRAPAAGTFTAGGVRGIVNVEFMGGALLIQHYHSVPVAVPPQAPPTDGRASAVRLGGDVCQGWPAGDLDHREPR